MSVLKDVLATNFRVVFCGTAVGAASARRRAYYAGPGNAFWPPLFQVGLIPIRFEPEQYKCITEYGLGLTDLAKTVSGSDRVLSRQHFDGDGLRAKMRYYSPKVLAFTSKRAAEEFVGRPVEYGQLEDMIGSTQLFVHSLGLAPAAIPAAGRSVLLSTQLRNTRPPGQVISCLHNHRTLDRSSDAGIVPSHERLHASFPWSPAL